VHPRGGHRAPDNLGLLGSLFVGLELARGFLGHDNVLAGLLT
jgi:hypothetical protein